MQVSSHSADRRQFSFYLACPTKATHHSQAGPEAANWKLLRQDGPSRYIHLPAAARSISLNHQSCEEVGGTEAKGHGEVNVEWPPGGRITFRRRKGVLVAQVLLENISPATFSDKGSPLSALLASGQHLPRSSPDWALPRKASLCSAQDMLVQLLEYIVSIWMYPNSVCSGLLSPLKSLQHFSSFLVQIRITAPAVHR